MAALGEPGNGDARGNRYLSGVQLLCGVPSRRSLLGTGAYYVFVLGEHYAVIIWLAVPVKEGSHS